MPRAKPPLTLDRRQLLKAAAGFGGVAAGGLLPFAARAVVPRTRIDVHAHLIPDFYRKAIDAYGVLDASGAALPDWSPSAAVSFMNKFGIQAQVLSLPEPGLAFIPELTERVRMATELNDYVRDELVYASSVTPYRGRFGGFATLPLGDPRDPTDVAAARAEAIRAISTLQLDGVVLYTSYKGVYLGDSKLAPLMQTLNALKARVMVVPVAPPLAPPDPSGLQIPSSVLELPFETTRVATLPQHLLAVFRGWRHDPLPVFPKRPVGLEPQSRCELLRQASLRHGLCHGARHRGVYAQGDRRQPHPVGHRLSLHRGAVCQQA